jgi:hypothetical protein
MQLFEIVFSILWISVVAPVCAYIGYIFPAPFEVWHYLVVILFYFPALLIPFFIQSAWQNTSSLIRDYKFYKNLRRR